MVESSGKGGPSGGGDSTCGFLVAFEREWVRASLGEFGCCVPRLRFKCTELRPLHPLVRIPGSGAGGWGGGISAGGNTEPEPDRLVSTSAGRAAGSEPEWRQLPRSSLSTGLRAAEPARTCLCVCRAGGGGSKGWVSVPESDICNSDDYRMCLQNYYRTACFSIKRCALPPCRTESKKTHLSSLP